MAFLVGLAAIFLFYAPRSREEQREILPIAIGSFALKAALIPIYYWILDSNGFDGFAGIIAPLTIKRRRGRLCGSPAPSCSLYPWGS